MRNSERPAARAVKPSAAANPPARSGSECYLSSALFEDVLWEQFQYLLEHTGQSCAPNCVDCGRLAQVKNWLLLPFHTAVHPPA